MARPRVAGLRALLSGGLGVVAGSVLASVEVVVLVTREVSVGVSGKLGLADTSGVVLLALGGVAGKTGTGGGLLGVFCGGGVGAGFLRAAGLTAAAGVGAVGGLGWATGGAVARGASIARVLNGLLFGTEGGTCQTEVAPASSMACASSTSASTVNSLRNGKGEAWGLTMGAIYLARQTRCLA